MKQVLIIALLAFTQLAIAQNSPVGIWKNIDDEDGEVKSHLEIYEVDGKIHAKVSKLLQNAELTLCTECKGDKKDQPLVGMDILWDMSEDGKLKWSGGKIMDPKNGKEYKCKIELVKPNKLKVRGYIGMPTFGRTQYWYRVTE